MRHKTITVLAIFLAFSPFLPLRADTKTGAVNAPPIALPADGDDYARLVAQAAAHDPATDFRALRLAYLKSAARKRENFDAIATLKKQMFAAVKAVDGSAVRANATKLLSMDYIDLYGQKFLRQSCAILHDDACAAQAHFVEFGLLGSIIHGGDGKTCQTGWEVVTIAEEYFVLDMLDASLQQQALIKDGHNCDAMTVTGEDGKQAVYYFNADAVLADEAKMFAPK